MYERFDANARNIWLLAGNIAAERVRERRGERGHVDGVKITLGDLRRAYHLIVGACGWSGGTSKAVERRAEERLPGKGSIGAKELKELLRHGR